MPWPPAVSNGQLTDAAQYDNLLTAVQVWPGGVSANGNSLTNLTALTSSNAGADPLTVTASALQSAAVKADHLAAYTAAGSVSIDSPQIWGGNVNAAGAALSNLATLSARTSDNKLTLNATGGIQVNAPQTWGGDVNAGSFSITNLNNLTVNGTSTLTGAVTAAGRINVNTPGDVVLWGGGKFLQLIAPTSLGANRDPAIQSSTGSLEVMPNVQFDGNIRTSGGFAANYRGYGTDNGQLLSTDYHVALTPGLHQVTLPATPVSGQILLLENATGADVTVFAQAGAQMVPWSGLGGLQAGTSVVIRNACCLHLHWTDAGYWRPANVAVAHMGLPGYFAGVQPASASVLGGVKQGNCTGVFIASDGTITGSLPRTVVNFSGSYQVTANDYFIHVINAGVTVLLPNPSIAGQSIYISDWGTSGTCTVDAGSGNTIYIDAASGGVGSRTIVLYPGTTIQLYSVIAGTYYATEYLPSSWINFTPSNARVGSGTGSVAYVSTGYAQFQVNKNSCTIRYNGTVNVTGTVTRIDIDVPGMPSTTGSTGGAGNYGNNTALGVNISGNTLYLYALVSGGAFPAGQTFFTLVLPYATS